MAGQSQRRQPAPAPAAGQSRAAGGAGTTGYPAARSKEPNQEPTTADTGPHWATASHHRCRQMPQQAVPSTIQPPRGCALQARGHWFEPSCAHQAQGSISNSCAIGVQQQSTATAYSNCGAGALVQVMIRVAQLVLPAVMRSQDARVRPATCSGCRWSPWLAPAAADDGSVVPGEPTAVVVLASGVHSGTGWKRNRGDSGV